MSITPKPKSSGRTTDANSVIAQGSEVAQSNHTRQVQYFRRSDGKGFVRKIVDKQTMDHIRATSVTNSKKKKKRRKPFRGLNYRFDGSRIKKRVAKRASSNQGSVVNGEAGGQDEEDMTPMFLEYLGIQRKDSAEQNVGSTEDGAPESNFKPAEPKAKKSFRPEADPPEEDVSR